MGFFMVFSGSIYIKSGNLCFVARRLTIILQSSLSITEIAACNHPMGPLALGDLIGLDVCLAIMEA